MRQKRTWNDNITNLVRDVFFPCMELKELMLIPPNMINNIQAMNEQYMLNDPMGEELMKDEKVRILYYGTEGIDIGHPNVRTKYLEFDIYVKRDHRYNVGNDGQKARDILIAQLIQELLTDNRYVSNMRFSYVDDYGLGVKTVGYVRHHIVFSYKATHK